MNEKVYELDKFDAFKAHIRTFGMWETYQIFSRNFDKVLEALEKSDNKNKDEIKKKINDFLSLVEDKEEEIIDHLLKSNASDSLIQLF